MLSDDFFLGTKIYSKIFTDICKPMQQYLGTTHAIYVNIDKNGRIFSVCTHPNWVALFLEEKYYDLDPLMVNPKNIHNGFSFDMASPHQEFKDKLLYDAVIKFNWCHSFAYIEKDHHGGYFGFDFGTTKDNYALFSRLANETQIVKKLIRDIHTQLMARVKSVEDYTMDFATLKGQQYHEQKGLVYHEKKDNEERIALLQELGVIKGKQEALLVTDVRFSRQEHNCLKHYVQSRNLKQIARDLNLALSTVSSYIENIKAKLQCHTKNELLEKAEILQCLGRL